jgi:hypothetical protein
MKVHEQITEQTWCRMYFARTQTDDPTPIFSERAAKWCLVGWLHKVYVSGWEVSIAVERLNSVLSSVLHGHTSGTGDLARWNNSPHTTFQQVHELLKRANV